MRYNRVFSPTTGGCCRRGVSSCTAPQIFTLREERLNVEVKSTPMFNLKCKNNIKIITTATVIVSLWLRGCPLEFPSCCVFQVWIHSMTKRYLTLSLKLIWISVCVLRYDPGCVYWESQCVNAAWLMTIFFLTLTLDCENHIYFPLMSKLSNSDSEGGKKENTNLHI